MYKYLLLFVATLSITSCSDPNYQKEKYVAFDSIDALVDELSIAIKNSDGNKLNQLIDNQALMLDALSASNSKNAKQLASRLNTPQGKKDLEIQTLNRKSKMEAFAGSIKQSIKITPQFKVNGIELQSNTPFAEGSPAKKQDFRIIFNNGENQFYNYQITVIQWNGYYHLIEADGFLSRQ